MVTIAFQALCKWVKAIDTFITIDHANIDKKTALKEAEEFFEEFQLTYKAKKKAVDDQEDLLNGLKQEQNENKEKNRWPLVLHLFYVQGAT